MVAAGSCLVPGGETLLKEPAAALTVCQQDSEVLTRTSSGTVSSVADWPESPDVSSQGHSASSPNQSCFSEEQDDIRLLPSPPHTTAVGPSPPLSTGAPPPAAPCGGCFAWLLGPGGAALGRGVGARAQGARSTSSSSVLPHCLDALEEIGLLGCGAFGSVTLVRCPVNGQVLALKSVSKGVIIEKRMQRAAMLEKLAMQRTCSPFVIRLVATLKSSDHLYFLMEVALGGDLCSVYVRYGFHGSEGHARFYAACMLRALEHLHERGVVYRDFKMENVVLDGSGYGKLCDFGMATCLSGPDDRAYTICGTPGYMAPEVLEAGIAGYSYAADWWSLGVLLYELLTGTSPFAAPDVSQMHAKVRAGIEAVCFPEGHLWPALVCGLCRCEPEERLPRLPGGAQQVEVHPWYGEADFNWQTHAAREMTAPHIPRVDGPMDLSNFCASWLDRPREVPYEDPGTGWEDGFEDPMLAGG